MSGNRPVIVGGGLSGAAAACLLASAGRAPLLLEREAGPRHKVCGEFLSVEAQASLARLDLDAARLGGASITSVRLVHGDRAAETDLPFRAIGLSRRVLDEALLGEAAARGAEIVRGASVRAVRRDGPDLAVEAERHGAIRTRTLFLASGKHELRGMKRDASGTRDDLVGFKLHLRLSHSERRAVGGAVEIVLFDGGYAGLQPIEDGAANLCLLVRRRSFERVGRTWDALIGHLVATAPHLARRLDGATALFERPLSISRVPYGFLHVPQAGDAPGLHRLGDQMAVIPSFSGDGMAIALHSGVAAARLHLAGASALDYHRRMRRDLRLQIRFASLLDRLARPRMGRDALASVASLWPAGLRLATLWTRVPDTALRRADPSGTAS